jgi:hypothetical protein
MRTFFTFLTLFLFGKFIFAQDTIVKINNEIIQSKIIEITPTEVRYKKYTFQEGPTYIENKSEIKYIKYSNGLKEEFASEKPNPKIEIENSANSDYYNPNTPLPKTSVKMEPYGSHYKYQGRKIGEREMQKILMKTQDKEIVNYIQTAKDAHALSFIGFAAFPLGMASIYFLGSSVNNNNTLNTGNFAASVLCLGGAIACPIISGVYKHKRKHYNSKAISIYNQKY